MHSHENAARLASKQANNHTYKGRDHSEYAKRLKMIEWEGCGMIERHLDVADMKLNRLLAKYK